MRQQGKADRKLSRVANNGSETHITGELHSSANAPFTLEFLASQECDASGFGEGQVFLGTASVSTDMSGVANFSVSLIADVPAGWFITATATLQSTGATSEFSACTEFSLVYGDINLDGSVNLLDVAPFVDLISISGYQIEADVNEDGNVNLLDVGPFVGLLNQS